MKKLFPLVLTLLTPVILLGHHETSMLRKNHQHKSVEDHSVHSNLSFLQLSDDTVNVIDTLDIYIPVELIYFKANYSDNRIILQWGTASELNSLEFEILYSTDGLSWQSIGKKAAAGNSQNVRSYSFGHAVSQWPFHYYRLIQRDMDGEEHLYEPIVVKADKNTSLVHPNPFSDYLTFKSDISMDLILTDHTGSPINQLEVKKGINQIVLEYLPKGVYYLTFRDSPVGLSKPRAPIRIIKVK